MLKLLFTIITSFVGMTCGCPYDGVGSPILLNSFHDEPHRIESDCWYSIESSASHHVPVVIERPSVDTKLVFYWEDIKATSLFTILFDWYRMPSFIEEHKMFSYNFFIDRINENGRLAFPQSLEKDSNGYFHDIYHCANNLGCDKYQEEAHTGDLYIKFLAPGSNLFDIGRFKISWEDHNPYIQETQLNHVKNLWNSCCLPKYIPPDKIYTIQTSLDYRNVFAKQRCDWFLSEDTSLNSLTTNSCEKFESISCDKDGNVIGIYVSNFGLQCDNFIDHISNFPKLQGVFATNNHLSGSLAKLSNLPKLTAVGLTDNLFSGSVPCFQNNTMVSLEIGMNKLTGVIPNCLENLRNLTILDLSDNTFDSQYFPRFLQTVNKLEILDLRNTNLHGEINSMYKFPRLHILNIAANHLSGSLPIDLVNSPTIKIIDVSFNFFSGEIPPITQSLITGYFGMNSFSGNLVQLFKFATIVANIDISHNKFSGTISEDFIKLYLNKNLILNLKGNEFECDPGTNSWPKTILHMNSVLKLGKCGKNNDPCNPCDECDPAIICKSCPKCQECDKISNYTYPVELQNQTVIPFSDNSVGNSANNDALIVIIIVVVCVILSTAGTILHFLYKNMRKSIYDQSVNQEEVSMINNKETTV